MSHSSPANGSVLPIRTAFALCFLLLATAAVYWPSLGGGFIFDDFANIVENPQLRLNSLDVGALWKAAHASPSTVLLRPLSMLTFALDIYLGQGVDPFRMKVTNLLVHLFNGMLLFGLLRSILRLPQVAQSRSDLLALCIAAAWLLAPINFTGVAYVVQRMESLCQTFVLAGLWAYVGARQTQQLTGRGTARLWAALLLGTAGGMLAKESAALLPSYALAVEAILFGFRDDAARLDRRVVFLFVALVALPCLVALCTVVPHFIEPGVWAGRDFTLTERLLTESRVLVRYILWTALPNPGSLSFYHDNVRPSLGILNPATTAASILLLLLLAAVAVACRRTHPLFSLGTFWFLLAHQLTATVIPLELVFEHRNYFASIGVFLAAFPLILPQSDERFLRSARELLLAASLVFYAGVSLLRALEWRDPLTFALAEAGKNPESPRAAYELGRTYVLLSGYDPNSPMLEPAMAELERAAAMPRSDCLGDVGLVMLMSRTSQPVPAEQWSRLWQKLVRRPPSAAEVSALERMVRCAAEKDCRLPEGEVVNTLLAALTHKPPNVKVLASLAKYLHEVMGETAQAISYTRQAIALSPADPNLRRNLLFLLLDANRIEEARAEYERATERFPEFAEDGRLNMLRSNAGDRK